MPEIEPSSLSGPSKHPPSITMSPETQSPRDDERRPLLATTQNGQGSRRKDLLQSARKEGTHALMAALTCSYSNVLLPCVPLGLMAGGWGWPPAAVFVLNFLAMLPLASILTFGTEQLAAIVGSVAGGLINATFGNAVEMIVRSLSLRPRKTMCSPSHRWE